MNGLEPSLEQAELCNKEQVRLETGGNTEQYLYRGGQYCAALLHCTDRADLAGTVHLCTLVQWCGVMGVLRHRNWLHHEPS